MARGEIVVKISGDESGLRRSLGNSENQLRSFGSRAASVGKRAAVALGTGLLGAGAAAAVFGKKAVDAASDLNESMSKVAVVFDDAAPAVVKWSKTAATSMGISQQAALEAAGTFGNLLQSMGVFQGPARKMSQSLIELASDLASFNNADPTEVLDALRSGIVGETEPLRRFGVSLSAARVEAEALSSGLAKGNVDMVKVESATVSLEKAQRSAADAAKEHGKSSLEARDAQAKVARAEQALQKAMAGSKVELTAAQKAQATYALILKDTKLAQGDFARTSGGLANQQRILKARFEDLSAKIGQKLLPIVVKVTAFINDNLFPAFEKISVAVEQLVGRFQTGGKSVDGLRANFEQIHARVQEVWPDIQRTINDALRTVQAVVAGVSTTISVLWNNFGNNIMQFTRRAWGPVMQIIRGAMQIIRGIVKTITSLIRGDWSGAWNGIKETLRGILNAIVGLIKFNFEWIRLQIGIALEIIGSMIKGAWRAAWNTTKDWWGKIVGFIEGIPAKILGVVGAVTGAAKAVGSAIWGGIKSGLGAVGDLLAGLRDAFDRTILAPIRSGIRSLANTLADVNIPGAGRAFDAASSALNAVANAIHLGDGGVVKARRGGTLALLGEKGEDEAVVPLNGRGGAFGGINIGTVVLGQSATLGDFSRELRWMQITRGVAARRP